MLGANTVSPAAIMEADKVRKMYSSHPWFWRMAMYFALFVIATVSFVFVRFPEEKLLSLANQAFSQAPLHMKAEGAKISFPPGLRLGSVNVAEKGRPDNSIASISGLQITPSILAWLAGNQEASIYADAMGGEISAQIKSEGEANGEVDVVYSFSGVNINQGLWWERFKWFKAGGKLEGKGGMMINRDDATKMGGSLKAMISEGWLLPGKSLSENQDKIAITSGNVEIKITKGRAKIVKCALEGPQIKLTATGGVTLSQQIGASRLNIVVILVISETAKEALGTAAMFLPPPVDDNKIIMKLGGTFGRPTFQ